MINEISDYCYWDREKKKPQKQQTDSTANQIGKLAPNLWPYGRCKPVSLWKLSTLQNYVQVVNQTTKWIIRPAPHIYHWNDVNYATNNRKRIVVVRTFFFIIFNLQRVIQFLGHWPVVKQILDFVFIEVNAVRYLRLRSIKKIQFFIFACQTEKKKVV